MFQVMHAAVPSQVAAKLAEDLSASKAGKQQQQQALVVVVAGVLQAYTRATQLANRLPFLLCLLRLRHLLQLSRSAVRCYRFAARMIAIAKQLRITQIYLGLYVYAVAYLQGQHARCSTGSLLARAERKSASHGSQ